ncbi:MAG: type II toxin-antitoxin system RelE/ParE family toxin [candidate division NC10 bacterium]|nr:type II toxin-antitoxin system RelE/ParE family toxin [candidate division NC10 bacterium]
MIIEKFRHKGLRRLYEDDDLSGVPAHSVRKIKAILAALEFADNLAQVATMPGWKLHPLGGDRKGEYSITVTGNWRITFRLQGHAVTDVNFEDYH